MERFIPARRARRCERTVVEHAFQYHDGWPALSAHDPAHGARRGKADSIC